MRSLAILTAACLSLGACAPAPQSQYDHHQRFANRVERRELVATVASPDDPVLADLAAESVRRGAGPAQVRAGDDGMARAVAEAIQRLGAAVTVEAGGGAQASVVVPVWQAEVPECGRWEEAITSDPANQNTWNFGCSVTRNIGLMVANPADLVRARDASGRDGARAADVLGKYAQGKATSSAAETGAKTTLSDVGK